MRRLCALALLLGTLAVPGARAQVRGAMSAHAGVGHFGFGSGRSIIGGFHHFRSLTRSPRSLAWLGDPFLYDDGYAYAPPVESGSPQVIVVPAAAPAPPAEAPRSAPLVIELQNGVYVRNAELRPGISEAPASQRPLEKSADLPPAVLIFRNGQTREVSNYAIIDRTMYVAADYWSTGAWNDKIDLADLDLPATTARNRARGVAFLLPGGPNQIVTRP